MVDVINDSGRSFRLFQVINTGHQYNPYDIYITDKNLTIRNTTYESDLGFNLLFAKDTFEIAKIQIKFL